MTPQTTSGRCEAYKPALGGGQKQCPRPAQYGAWCHFHARSVGGWTLMAPNALGDYRRNYDAAKAREAQALVLDALEAAVGAIQPVTQSGERYSAGFRAGVADAKAEFLEAIQQQRSKP